MENIPPYLILDYKTWKFSTYAENHVLFSTYSDIREYKVEHKTKYHLPLTFLYKHQPIYNKSYLITIHLKS